MVIYKITNIINNKVYIGQTSESIKRRFNRHMGHQSLDFDTKFYRAVRKCGRENFVIEQIDSAKNQKELNLLNHAMITARCRRKTNTPYKKIWLFEYL